MTNTAPEGKKKMTRRRKLAVAGTGVLAGLGGIAVLAAWTDSVTVGTELSSGEFAFEISTDGGTWNEAGALNLTDEAPLAPGETRVATAQLRLSEGSTHAGVLTDVELATEGMDGVDWTMELTNGTNTGEIGGPLSAGTEVSPTWSATPEGAQTPIVVNKDETIDITLEVTGTESLKQNTGTNATWTLNGELDN